MQISSSYADIKMMLESASKHLRDTSGRRETKGPRRILTEAAKIVGTDAPGVDLTKRNITARVKL